MTKSCHFLEDLMDFRKVVLRSTVAFISFFIVVGIALSHSSSQVSAQRAVRQAGSARTSMLVSTDWLAKNLKNQRVVILHVANDRKAYDNGHIPGARFLGWSEVVAAKSGASNELPPVAQLKSAFEKIGVGDTSRIIIYGDSNGLTATRTWFTLDYLGHGSRAAILDGGIEKWKSENRALESQPPAYEPAAFTPRLNPSVIATTETVRDYSWVSSNMEDPGVAIIDARTAEQYAGAPNTRTGHIPGAASMYWQKHLNEKDRTSMKPLSELIKMYHDLGVKPGDKVITYCNTGVQASHSYFTLKYLGFDVSMYDGSISEWTKVQDAPLKSGPEKK